MSDPLEPLWSQVSPELAPLLEAHRIEIMKIALGAYRIGGIDALAGLKAGLSTVGLGHIEPLVTTLESIWVNIIDESERERQG